MVVVANQKFSLSLQCISLILLSVSFRVRVAFDPGGCSLALKPVKENTGPAMRPTSGHLSLTALFRH